MKKTIQFGKIAYYGNRRENMAEVTIELRPRGGEETFTIDPITKEKKITGKTPEYVELSICGAIWNRIHTDWLSGGQNLDEIAKYIKTPLFREIYGYWKRYHLNGMNAGTPEQTAAIEEWKQAGNKYDYTAACEELKRRGLYEVNFTGKTVGRVYNNEPYKYGHGWIIEERPPEVVARITEIISA